MGHVVQGKVTYKGEPVPYGFILMYSLGKGLDQKTGALPPTAFGDIRDGKYRVPNAPAGPVMVCVATDPDVEPFALIRPMVPGGVDPSAGPPGLPAPKATPNKSKLVIPKELPQPGPPPTGGAPGGVLKGPPADPDAGLPGGDPKAGPPGGFPGGHKGPPRNPIAANLTDAQKDRLREIHAKYGILGKSHLSIVVKDGEQTHDFVLK
jgi:hypothetical protein